MKILITYQSKTGFTKKYAEWENASEVLEKMAEIEARKF